MGSEYVGLVGIAKGNAVGHPNAVANELICGTLGRGLCLPIPPAAIVEKDGRPYHVSLSFNLSGESLPPANPAAIVTDHPQLACGVVLFDSWIVNGDRHQNNLAYNTATKELQLFDHSHAFLPNGHGVAFLQYNANNLGIGGHCLAPELRSLDGMTDWFERINELPKYYIEDVLASAVRVGLPESAVPGCLRALLERREKLLDLVQANRTAFPNVQVNLWDELA